MQDILKLQYKNYIIFWTYKVVEICIKLMWYIKLKTGEQHNNALYNTDKRINKYWYLLLRFGLFDFEKSYLKSDPILAVFTNEKT